MFLFCPGIGVVNFIELILRHVIVRISIMKVFVIIPTYNEKENIGALTSGILALPVSAEVVVVDDNSPDGTGALLDGLKAGEKRLHVIHRAGKLGLGTAHIAGLKYAMEKGADLAVTMDADFSHDPSYIPSLMEAAKNFDIVIGSRYVRGGGAENSPFHRRLLSRGANLFAKAALGLKASDCTAGFRCYKVSTLRTADLGGIFSNGYSFLIEMLYKLQRLDFRVGEVPIRFIDRELGASKISKNEIFRALYTVGILFWTRISPLNRLRMAFHTGRYLKVKAMLGPGKTLDIGCGRPCECMPDQAFLRFLARPGAVGLDLRDIKGPYGFFRGSVTAMPFKDGELDNVVAMEILEHINDVPAALAEIKRALKPGGVLVVSTPDNSPLWNLIWEIWSGTVGRMWHHDHLVSYNADEWRAMLERYFEVTVLRRHWRFDLVFRCVPSPAKL